MSPKLMTSASLSPLSQLAKLLGYSTHAEYILEMRMAKTPETVATFLSGLAEKLRTLQREELEGFLKYKEEDVSRFFSRQC